MPAPCARGGGDDDDGGDDDGGGGDGGGVMRGGGFRVGRSFFFVMAKIQMMLRHQK